MSRDGVKGSGYGSASGRNQLGLEASVSGTTGTLASTYDRAFSSAAAAGAATSGTLRLWRIILPAGMTITNIIFWAGTTALVSGSNQWFGLFDSSRNRLRLTADDTNTAWAASTAKSLALTTPYVTTYAGWHYLGICIVAATVPTIESLTCIATGSRGAAPVVGGNSTTGLTDPASCPATAGAISPLSQFSYGEVS